jgi:hypothetical protein
VIRRSTFVCRSLLAGALLLAVPSASLAHDPRGDRPSRWIGTASNLPLVTSPNVRLVDTFPETQGISGEFARTGNFFYVSSLDSISVFDTTDPLRPRLTGTLANLVFENEAMSYGAPTARSSASCSSATTSTTPRPTRPAASSAAASAAAR